MTTERFSYDRIAPRPLWPRLPQDRAWEAYQTFMEQRAAILDAVAMQARAMWQELGHTNFSLRVSVDEWLWMTDYSPPGTLLGSFRPVTGVLLCPDVVIKVRKPKSEEFDAWRANAWP